MRYSPFSAAALLFLSACGQQTSIDNEAVTEPPAPVAPTPLPSPSAVPAAAIRLDPLRPTDADGLEGELACSFATEAGAQPLLIGRANVGDRERASAVIRIGDRVDELAAAVPGGFGALTRGLAFGGQGLTITIERHAAQKTGDESTAHEATLVAQRGDGAAEPIDGLWTCGP